jgi:glycogen debranching enzyme
VSNQLNILYNDSLKLLRQLSTSQGILASTLESDNYKRIWARDSIICGIAGLLAEDKTIVQGLKASLLTLAKHQNKQGIIPSNVLEKENDVDISYGSLVGRVDTNTWFIVGCCLYYLNTKDEETWLFLIPSIFKSRNYLKTIELNGKGWIYTPLSGNWADEYPIHGYTLYDNMLRLWGESLWLKTQKKQRLNLII